MCLESKVYLLWLKNIPEELYYVSFSGCVVLNYISGEKKKKQETPKPKQTPQNQIIKEMESIVSSYLSVIGSKHPSNRISCIKF